MATARIRIGLPLQGLVLSGRDEAPSPAEPDAWGASELDGFWIKRNRSLRPLPSIATYAPTADAVPIALVRNVLFGDGAAQVIRHTHNSINTLSSGAWTNRDLGAAQPASTTAQRFGAALVPGNTGRGYYIFSTNYDTGADQIFFWDGAAATISVTWAAGAPQPGRHVVPFADRAMVFDQVIAGNARRRSSQWSVAGDGITWSGTGSGSREFGEFESAITGAAPLRGRLYVYSERAMLEGIESFDVDAPVYYQPIVTNGVGIWAPNSLLTAEDSHYFLSHAGFRSWNGQQIQSIGAPVDDHIISNIERGAIETVCGVYVPPPYDWLMWALPMSTTGLPSEIWIYDRRYNRWLRSTTLYSAFTAVTALGIVVRAPAVSWDSFGGGVTWDSFVAGRTWDSFGGTATDPIIVSGHNDGTIRAFEPATNNSSITVRLRTRNWTWEGTAPLDARFPRSASIRPGDMTTLDGLELKYRALHATANSTLHVRLSPDNGATWESLGTITLTAGATDRLRTAFLGFRVTSPQHLLELVNVDPATGVVSAPLFEIDDLAIFVQRAGEQRIAS